LPLSQAPTVAWNALGHRVVADIAYRELGEATRKQVADTIRRNPRFDEDFALNLPADDQDRYIFQQAVVWPDIGRLTFFWVSASPHRSRDPHADTSAAHPACRA
jgi:hypothetical protein